MTTERKIRVLVVDDDPSMRTTVSIHLRHLGFDVDTANNGVQALKKLRPDSSAHYDADVVLLDLLMPIMTGYEFLEHYAGPVPVVVMSGLGDVAMLPRQPYAIAVKPMSMIDVAETLRTAAASWRTLARECG